MTPDQLYQEVIKQLDVLQERNLLTPLHHRTLHAAMEVAYDGGDEHLQSMINAETPTPKGAALTDEDVAFFKRHGFTHEYPGFLLYRVFGYDMTVGDDQRGRTGYCVQFSRTDGDHLSGKDCDTREEVVDLLEAFAKDHVAIIKALKEPK